MAAEIANAGPGETGGRARARDVSQEPEGPEVPGPRAEPPGALADEVASALGRIFG
ncbi:MAG TPA: hypothetical protein VGG75_33400 [Trebonia sp.]|jgi:hypothetical protein